MRNLVLPSFLVLLVISSSAAEPPRSMSAPSAQQVATEAKTQASQGDIYIGGVKLTDLLLIALTASALFLTWVITTYQWKLARKQTAIQLHADYYSIQHYADVVSPSVQIRLKWLYLPDETQRMKYRAAVAAGWAPAALGDGEDLSFTKFRLYVRHANLDSDVTAAHFHTAVTGEGLSEHQAVAAFLHFWSRVAGLLHANAVDRNIVKELFRPAFLYNGEFFSGLSKDVEDALRDDPRPAWVDHVAYLQQFFR